MNERILVSVIIPTYKRSEMLSRAVDSVLGQTYGKIQVIVVDDNDPLSEYRDFTSKTMIKYSDNSKVKYICHEYNKNGAAARNTGIKYSDGQLITFLDDDDFYMPDKIEHQVSFLENNPQYRAVYCGWNREGKNVIPSYVGDLSYHILSGDLIIFSNTIMMYKKEALACGGWNETFQRYQEAAFLLRYFQMGEVIGVVEKPLVVFDISDRSNEASNAKKNEEHVLYYLNVHKDIILRMREFRKNADKKIYSQRYRGILLCYIKNKDIKGAFSFWWRKCMRMPFRMIYVMICYTLTYRKSK